MLNRNGTSEIRPVKNKNRLVIDRGRQAQHEITVDESSWSRFSETQSNNDPVNEFAEKKNRQQLKETLAVLSPGQRRVLL